MAVCRFRARLYAVSVNRCIDVPQEVSHALGGQTHIRVRGVIGSEEFRVPTLPLAAEASTAYSSTAAFGGNCASTLGTWSKLRSSAMTTNGKCPSPAMWQTRCLLAAKPSKHSRRSPLPTASVSSSVYRGKQVPRNPKTPHRPGRSPAHRTTPSSAPQGIAPFPLSWRVAFTRS